MDLKKGCLMISRPSSGPEPNLKAGFLSNKDSRRSTALSLDSQEKEKNRSEEQKMKRKERKKRGKPDPIGVAKFTVQRVVKELITVLRIERMRATKLGENREVEETSKEKAELEKGSHHFIDDHTERPPVDGKSVVEIE